jgi:hypothetical protein
MGEDSTRNPTDADRQALNPTALAVADAARLLGVPVEVVQKGLAERGPASADGSVNLIHYAAWLNRKAKRLTTCGSRRASLPGGHGESGPSQVSIASPRMQGLGAMLS